MDRFDDAFDQRVLAWLAVAVLLLTSASCATKKPSGELPSATRTPAKDALMPPATDSSPPPRSPAESLASIRVAEGLRVELVAAEPLVRDPVSFDFGPDGKLWVAEMADYPLGVDDQGKPGGRVRFLEDADGDGRFEKSTLFLEDVSFPTGIIAWRRGALVSAAPDLFYAEDTDGDGRADKREVLYTGFGEGNQQHRINGFFRGLDNWLYLANGDSNGVIRSTKTGKTVDIAGMDVRIRPDEGAIDTFGGGTQYGLTRDDWGNWFGCMNSRPAFQFVLDEHYLRRSPLRPNVPPQHEVVTLEGTSLHPISRFLVHCRNYHPPKPGQPTRFTSACSVLCYRDEALGPGYRDNLFLSEPFHDLVHREVLDARGLTFSAHRGEKQPRDEFLASTDSWSRPASIRTGPDGALWMADMYRMVIEHPHWIDEALLPHLDLRAGHDRGRIYRVVPQDSPLRLVPRLDRMDATAVVDVLENPNGTQRDLAQQWLVEHRDDPEVANEAVPRLQFLVAHGTKPWGRLHALCTLDGQGRLSEAQLVTALGDEHPGVRRHAVRLSEPFLASSNEVAEGLIARVADDDPHVRLQVAFSLGEWDDPRVGQALGNMALSNRDDADLAAAVISSVNAKNIDQTLSAVLAGKLDAMLAERVLVSLLTLGVILEKPEVVASGLAAVVAPRGASDATWQMATAAAVLEALARQRVELNTVADEATRQQLTALLEQAGDLTEDADAPEATRATAVRLLGSQEAERVDITRLAELLAPQSPAVVQTAVVAALARTARDGVPALLLAGWPSHSPTLRAEILDVLLSRDAWAGQLLKAIEQGAPAAGDIDATRRQRLLIHDNAQLRNKAERLFATNSSSRAEVVQQHEDVLTLAGSPAAGRDVFLKQCAACHRLEGVGFDVGMNLQSLANRTPEALLTAILDPSRAIEDRFLQYNVITADGLTFSGLIGAESENSITLRGQEGKEQVVPRREIEVLRNTGKSLMPEGMEKVLTKQELADVIAFIGALKPTEAPGATPAN